MATIISKELATEIITGIAAADMRVLKVAYKNYPRALHIFYTAAFPYEIVGWEEIRPLKEGGQEVSRATRKALLITDYWTKNKKEHEPLRQELQLDQ